MDSSRLVLLIIVATVYFIPSLCAIGKKNSTAITVLNIFLGWTFIGWVVALVWAVSYEKPKN